MKKILEKYFSEYFLKIKGLIPQAKAVTSVGLDIGTSFIKAVKINNFDQSHEIEKFAIEPLNNADVSGSITKVLENAQIDTKIVNTSVSGQGVIIRYTQMPKMPLPDIKSSIILEADKYFPFPLDEVVMDCFILEERTAENKVLVLVAAAKKDLIEQRVSQLSSLNLEVETIYTDSIAMANIFDVLGKDIKKENAESPSAKPSAMAVLNIGGTYSNLNIVRNNITCFTRDIFIGGVDFTKRISNILALDMKSAEELKIAPQDQKGKILEACESVWNNLVTEVRLSFDYFETESNIPVGLLYLSGGGSCLTGLDEIMKQNLGVEVKLWQPFSGLNIHPGLPKENFICNANKLIVAVGLGLK